MFVTDDRSLLAVCRYLHDEFGFAIKAMSLADYLDSRAPSGLTWIATAVLPLQSSPG